jgi:intergrase/recombinase
VILSYLDRYVKVIRQPMDIVRTCVNLTDGQKHNLNRALGALFRFYELKGVNANYLAALRKAIPKDNVGVDLYVPTEAEIVESLTKLKVASVRYQALYNLLLDSGLMLTEAVKLLNNFEGVTEINGFYRCTLGYFRGCKLAYAAYFSKYAYELIQQSSEQLDASNASHYYYKYGLTAVKYLRKFAFDTMISESFNIPESVADFIEGRVPMKIGAKHYTRLLKQADGFYGKYADYLSKLRAQVLT